MIDFIKWCQSRKLPLPSGEATTDEQTKRTGLGPQYPDGYIRSQYMDKGGKGEKGTAYFAPYKATAYLDLQNARGNVMKSGGKKSPV